MANQGSTRKRPLTASQIATCKRLKAIWNERRLQLDLTQDKAAEKIGITQGGIAHYLNQRNALTLPVTLWFADILQVHPLDIDPDLLIDLPMRMHAALDAAYPPQRSHQSGTEWPAHTPASYSIHEQKSKT